MAVVVTEACIIKMDAGSAVPYSAPASSSSLLFQFPSSPHRHRRRGRESARGPTLSGPYLCEAHGYTLTRMRALRMECGSTASGGALKMKEKKIREFRAGASLILIVRKRADSQSRAINASALISRPLFPPVPFLRPSFRGNGEMITAGLTEHAEK